MRNLAFICSPMSLALFCLGGCGDEIAPSPPSPARNDVGLPPAAPEGAPLPDGPRVTFAVSKMRLGRTSPLGILDNEAWKSIGYNLDRTVTMKSSAGVFIGEETCTRGEGAELDTIFDGNEGRDNGFGSRIMPIILAVMGGIEKANNVLISQGKHTLLIDVQGLGSSPTYQSLPARMYAGRFFVDAKGMPAMPRFDGTDVWPVAFESVENGSIEAPRASSKEGYVAAEGAGGTFVGKFGGSIALPLPIAELPEDQGWMYLRIYEPLVTMRLSADRSRVESGILAGYLDTLEIDLETSRVVGVFDPNLCNSLTSESLRTQVRQAADILRGGRVDPAKRCDSISVGIEFTAERAQVGALMAPAEPIANPCAP